MFSEERNKCFYIIMINNFMLESVKTVWVTNMKIYQNSWPHNVAFLHLL